MVFTKPLLPYLFLLIFFNLKFFVPFFVGQFNLSCLLLLYFRQKSHFFSANQSVCLSVPLWNPYFQRLNNFGHICKKQNPRTPRGLSFKIFSAKLINFPHYFKILCQIRKISVKFAPWNMKNMSNLNIGFKYINTM